MHDGRGPRRLLSLAVVGIALGAGVPAAGRPRADAEALMARTKAMYAALQSYADTGMVEHEFGTHSAPARERHSFTTAYRAPRHLRFDYTTHRAIDRFVLWGDDESFYTWWRRGGTRQTFPKGRGAGAFTALTAQTRHAVVQIPSLLFHQAGLAGTVTELGELSLAGQESIGGRPCYRITGVAKSVYGTGYETNVRKTTIWIDVATMAIRKIVEETHQGAAAGSLNRLTTSFEPRLNPALEDSQFAFVPPTEGTR